MRIFEIYDSRKRGHKPCALLTITPEGAASIEIFEGVGPEDVPMLFSPFIEQGLRVIPDKWAWRWIDERVVPSGRQNLAEVLKANDLEDYDQVELLAKGQGRSSQDDFLVRERGSYQYAVVSLSEEKGRGIEQSVLEVIGERIAALRMEKGITQRELAEITGIQQNAISRIEAGKGNPTLKTVCSLVDGLGAKLSFDIS